MSCHSGSLENDRAYTSQTESFFSRLRRMVGGQHYKVSAHHLHAYANHAAWMEDYRRLDNGALATRALGLALGHAFRSSGRAIGTPNRPGHG